MLKLYIYRCRDISITRTLAFEISTEQYIKVEKLMQAEIKQQVTTLLGDYGWMFIAGMMMLLFRSTIENAVAGLMVFIGSDYDEDDVIELDGKRYSHILNPKTGWPVAGLSAVSVWAPQSIVAGSISTIAMLKPIEEAINLVFKAFKFMIGGEIIIPKLPSIKILNLAKAIDSRKKIKIIGIRPGEKLHEELISKEEWLRTTDHENYLIGTESTNDELWSYNSKDSLMDTSETYKFLQDSGVVI